MKTSLSPKNIFTPTPCIPAEELRLYAAHQIGGKALRTIEEHLADCELCSAAAEGFLLVAVSGAELKDLNARLDRLNSQGWLAQTGIKIFIGLSSVTLIAGGVWMMLSNSPKTQSQNLKETSVIARSSAEKSVPYANANQEQKSDTAQTPSAVGGRQTEKYMEENTVSVSASTENAPVFAANTDNTASNTSRFPARMNSNSIQNSNSLVMPGRMVSNSCVNVSDNSLPGWNMPSPVTDEKPVKTRAFNHPVQYISSLKVSDYNALYLTSGSTEIRVRGGTPADREETHLSDNNAGFSETSRIQRADVVLRQGLFSFSRSDYEGALGKFSQLRNLNRADINSVFYSAVCYYRLNKPDKCISLLNQVLEMENNAFAEEAQWYKALALIKKQNPGAAKEILHRIIEEKGFYSEDAENSLKTLK